MSAASRDGRHARSDFAFRETAMLWRRLGLTRRRIFVLLTCVVLTAAVVVYLAVWIPGLPGPLHGAYVSRGLLHNVYEGLRYYDEANGHLPQAAAKDPESGNLSSWRIEVCRSFVRLGFSIALPPNITSPLDYDYHRAWNDPCNARIGAFGSAYFVPATPHLLRGASGIYATYYKAVTGPGTAFDCAAHASLKQLPEDVILIVQVARSDTHWMEPSDLCIDELIPCEETKRLLLTHDGYVVLFADGERWVLSRKTPISDLCKFLTVAGAKEFSRDELLAPYRVLP